MNTENFTCLLSCPRLDQRALAMHECHGGEADVRDKSASSMPMPSSLKKEIDDWDLFLSKSYGEQDPGLQHGNSQSSSSRPVRSLTEMLTRALGMPASSQPSSCPEHSSPVTPNSEDEDTSCPAASTTDGPAHVTQKPLSKSARAVFREKHGYDKGPGKTSCKQHKKKHKEKKKMEQKSPPCQGCP